MFRTVKKQAKTLLKSNYKSLFLPTLIFMTLNAFVYLITDWIGSFYIWPDLNGIFKAFFVVLYLSIQLVFIPLVTVMIYKICDIIVKGGAVGVALKEFFTKDLIKRAILLNLIPRVLALIEVDFRISTMSVFTLFGLGSMLKFISPVLILIIYYFYYKFLICNCYLVVNNSSVRNAMSFSFKKSKVIFIKYIGFELSFSLWYLLSILIYIILQVIHCRDMLYLGFEAVITSKVYYIEVFNSFWYGLGFYVLPYMFLATFLFIQKETDKKSGLKSRG